MNTRTPGASATAADSAVIVVDTPDETPAKVEKPAKRKLSSPSALLTGRPLPTREWTAKLHDGTEITILLQGLTNMAKSEIDGRRNRQQADEERTGVSEPNLWGARLVAAAAREPDGSIAFADPTKREAFAAMLAEQVADGLIATGGNIVLDLSGYARETPAAVGKSSTTTRS